MNDPAPTAALQARGIEGITFMAATRMEARAIVRRIPDAHVVTCGMGLSRQCDELRDCVVSCGVAGGLRHDLPTGTVVIPDEVGRADGGRTRCDPPLVEAFAHAARALGIEPVIAPLLTSDNLVTGDERQRWAALGFVAVDMETARIAAPRVAAVRVILDTPQRELSPDWHQPLRALLKPWNWPQAFWLAREAPKASELAARVVAQGIGHDVRITRQW
ncbi:MAG: hypothetical protein JO030_06980 [Candidatus Eremiobacteraeota bacterium]|nr:hypothetical protein [Candidatus Eremiobacteraeota bacterium]